MDQMQALPHFGGKLMSTQVSALLMRELKSGIFSNCEKLPSEMELANKLGVSRTVIRDSLSDIEREGFIERVRGIGTVINRSVVNMTHRLDLKLEYADLIREGGHTPHTDLLHISLVSAPEHIAAALGLKMGDTLIKCDKRILANNIPVIYSSDYLCAEMFSGIELHEINWSEPIFDILERCCGLTVVTDVTEITPVVGPVEIRRMLNCNDENALLKMEECSYSRPTHPVLYSLSYYTDFFNFKILRKKF